MSAAPGPSSARLQVREPEGGQPLSIGDSTFIAGPEQWSDGAVLVLEQVVAPGLIGPPHVHEHESQACYVLSGRIGHWVGGEEVEVGPGGYVHRPAGTPHSLWNKNAEPASILEITYPAASFERYMRRLSDLIDSGGGDPDSVGELAAQFGIRFIPEPLEELCRRHGVNPAGGFWK